MRRFGVPVLALALLLGSCTGGSTSASGPGPLIQPSLVPYHSGPPYHLAFRYPVSWTAREYQEVSSFTTLIVYLSNQPMAAPCRTTKSATVTSVDCRLAVEHLERGGLLVWWNEASSPGWTFDKDAQGEPLTVGGHRARLSMSVTPQCRGIGADVSMKAVIEKPQVMDNWYEFDACIRGPGVSAAEAQVRALLASARFGD